MAAGRPAVFLGSRGSAGFTLRVRLRRRSYYSGNWGGLLRNPATVLASAIGCLVDGRLARQALRLMTGLFWDLGEYGTAQAFADR